MFCNLYRHLKLLTMSNEGVYVHRPWLGNYENIPKIFRLNNDWLGSHKSYSNSFILKNIICLRGFFKFSCPQGYTFSKLFFWCNFHSLMPHSNLHLDLSYSGEGNSWVVFGPGLLLENLKVNVWCNEILYASSHLGTIPIFPPVY